MVDLPAPAVQLSLGTQHSCALSKDGDVLCWGSNKLGQAGAGRGVPLVPRPRKVGGLEPAVQIAAGATNTCAVTREHRVYCWGENLNQQSSAAEIGVEPEVWTPREITVARGSERVVAGSSTFCGIKPDGTVLCWGFVRSLLGDQYAKRSSGNVAGLADVRALGLGDDHACALVGTGEVWCFGRGERGELGNGKSTSETQPPRKVALPGHATEISVGAATACARADGRWYCWGVNRKGELNADKRPVWMPAVLELSRVDHAE